MTALIRFHHGRYTLSACVGALPLMYAEFVDHAILHEDFGVRADDGTMLFCAVASASHDWPELVVALRFAPGPEAGFHPGFLLVPDSRRLFIGAGERLLAYELSPARRLW